MSAAVKKASGAVLTFALLAQIATMLPVFLLGTLFPLMAGDLGAGVQTLGYAVAMFFAGSAFGAAFLAGYSDRLGPWRVARLSLVGATILCVAIAATPNGWWLIVAMAVAGLANGCVQPATNVAISQTIAKHRQGFAFGVKQASVPLATLLAGLAVPVIGLTAGWRVAYLCGADLAATLSLVLPHQDAAKVQAATQTAHQGWSFRVLVLLAVMAGLGAGTANAMAAFLVTFIEAQGLSISLAGLLMALGSLVSIVIRVALGVLADRYPLPLLATVSVLFLGGACAYALFAQGGGWGVIILATVLAFGMGWGWAGLSVLAIVRANPAAPGRATGVVQSGLFLGAVFGPLGFGWTVTAYGFSAAWLALAYCATLAALIPAAFVVWGLREGQPPKLT